MAEPPPVALDAVPALHPHAAAQRVGGRLLAVSPDAHLHTFLEADGRVSEVGERILELADGKRTLGEIVAALCAEYDVPQDACARDAADFVRLLVEKQVLVLGRRTG